MIDYWDMRQPEPNRDSQAFLSALADELLITPDQATAQRHVAAATAVARLARDARRDGVTRWAAASVIVATLCGTGGIAVAGGLPAPVQQVVADLARALPVPLHVPYPTIASQTLVPGTGSDRRPEEGEESMRPSPPSAKEEDAQSSAGEILAGSSAGAGESSVDIRANREETADRGSCDVADLWEARDDIGDPEEVRAWIRDVCDGDFADPPRWIRSLMTHDLDHDGDGAWDDDHRRGDEEGGDLDDDFVADAGDSGFDSSDTGRSDDSEEDEDDEQEERHDDDEDDDREGSSTDEWRDRHD